MPPRFLADENLNAKIIAGLLRRESSIDFQPARAAGILGFPDEEVLAIAAHRGRILISHDRETMPAHYRRACKAGASGDPPRNPKRAPRRHSRFLSLLRCRASRPFGLMSAGFGSAF